MTQTPTQSSEPNVAAAPAARTGSWTWLVLIAVIAALGYYGYRYVTAPPKPAVDRPTGRAAARARSPRGVPVVAEPVRKGDIDVYLNGLGTVTPLRTVTVRSRVDGQLLRVLFDEGQMVKEGQLLAEIDPRPYQVQLAQAQGQRTRNAALLENARLDLERYRTLYAQDAIAKQLVDTQAALVRQYQGALQIDRSQIDSAKLQLTYARVTAPVSGRAGLRLIDQGNIVRAGDATGLVVITQLKPVAVVFNVPQDDLPAVMKRSLSGDRIPVEAWDREQKTRLATGWFASADNQVDPATGTVKLKAQFDNDDAALFPNQFVNVRMKLDTLHGATVIPSAATQRGVRGMYVYLVKDDSTVAVRGVRLGAVNGLDVAVLRGLAPGDMIVVDGNDRLRAGAKVDLIKRPVIKPPAGGRGARRKPAAGAGKAPRRKPAAE